MRRGLGCAALLVGALAGCYRSTVTGEGPRDGGLPDGGVDGSADAATDGGGDGPDASAIDGGAPPLAPVALLAPDNGHATGSALAPPADPGLTHPLRPRLRWLATEGASRYELELTDDCPVLGFRDCAFADPTYRIRTTALDYTPDDDLAVSREPPVGRRYFWRVRACRDETACGAWSPVRYLDVGRLRGDVDGDGYGDLVLTAFDLGGDPGTAQLAVAYGSPSGPGTPVALRGAVLGVSFSDVVRGDFDADGFGDIAFVDAPSRPGSSLVVHRGSRGGLQPEPDEVRFPDDSIFQPVLVPGDFDGNGLTDLFVPLLSTTGIDVQVQLALMLAGRDGLRPALVLRRPEAARELVSLAVRDLDGDGNVDLVSASGERRDLRVLSLGEGDLHTTDLEAPIEAESSVIYYPGVVADLDGDARPELAVLVASRSLGGGARFPPRLRVLSGFSAGRPTGAARELQDPRPFGGTFGFAVALALGDLDRDGRDDLIVGDVDDPAVYAFRGDAVPDLESPDATLMPPYDRESGIAARLVLRDVDGDGTLDVFVGARLGDREDPRRVVPALGFRGVLGAGIFSAPPWSLDVEAFESRAIAVH